VARNVNDIIRKLSAAQRNKVEARAAQLIAEEVKLRKIQEARKPTYGESRSPRHERRLDHLE